MNLENKIEAQRKRMEQEKNKLDMLMKKAKIEQRKADNHRKIHHPLGRCCAFSEGCRMSGGHPFARTEDLAEGSRRLSSQPISAGHPFTVIIMA